MANVFVYATLKDRMVQRRALGHTIPNARKAFVRGFREIMVPYGGQRWPTLSKSDDWVTEGEIFETTARDLLKLEAWENHYRLQHITTLAGDEAVCFVIDPLSFAKDA